MEKFITDNWMAIIGVLVAIIVGLAITWIVMDRKDKKLIAEYKAQIKAAKAEVDTLAEKVEEAKAEPAVEEKPAKAPAKKPAAAKVTTTAKKAPATAAKKPAVAKAPATATKKPAAKPATKKPAAKSAAPKKSAAKK